MAQRGSTPLCSSLRVSRCGFHSTFLLYIWYGVVTRGEVLWLCSLPWVLLSALQISYRESLSSMVCLVAYGQSSLHALGLCTPRVSRPLPMAMGVQLSMAQCRDTPQRLWQLRCSARSSSVSDGLRSLSGLWRCLSATHESILPATSLRIYSSERCSVCSRH